MPASRPVSEANGFNRRSLLSLGCFGLTSFNLLDSLSASGGKSTSLRAEPYRHVRFETAGTGRDSWTGAADYFIGPGDFRWRVPAAGFSADAPPGPDLFRAA